MTTLKVTFEESTIPNRSKIVTLPKVKEIKSITVKNSGTVTLEPYSGDDYIVKVSGGTPTRIEDSSSGYWDYKTIQTTRTFPEIADGCDPTLDYVNSDGYAGLIPCTSCFHNTNLMRYEGVYSGTGKKWINTSSSTYYYAYEVTIEYIDRATPVGTVKLLNLTIPVFNPADIAGKNQLRIQTTKGTNAFELVATTDENASPLRVQTANGIKAIAR